MKLDLELCYLLYKVKLFVEQPERPAAVLAQVPLYWVCWPG